MKILHLVAGELNGGAARGAYWLHTALRELGIDSRILGNARDIQAYESVDSIANSRFGKVKVGVSRRIGRAPLRLYSRRPDVEFNTGIEGFNITSHPAYAEADLIHLHWVNGLVSVRALLKVRKPIVWTLRDMWPMTGGCHYSMDCERFMDACGRCPQLESTCDRDLTRFLIRHKQKSLPPNIRAVGISRWLSECARRSTLFRNLPVATIANNVDTRTFTPLDKSLAKRELGLSEDRKTLLVGAQYVASAYKGFDLFLQTLGDLDNGAVQVLLFGRQTAQIPESLRIPSIDLGFLADTISLRRAYSAADVFVAPSRADAFGKTLVEAMACGTPVVCFDAMGPKDIVEHRVNGYRAEPFNASDLARGIEWILERESGDYQQMCQLARIRAESHFDSRVIAKRYIRLYQECIANQNDSGLGQEKGRKAKNDQIRHRYRNV
jgi:glycosyltransferase involved in cell wall biosynthesis